MNITAEAKELLRNAEYGDGLATVHTQDCEALEAAVKHSDAIAPKLAEALRAFVEWGHQYEDEGMDEWTAQVLKDARAALAEWEAQ